MATFGFSSATSRQDENKRGNMLLRRLFSLSGTKVRSVRSITSWAASYLSRELIHGDLHHIPSQPDFKGPFLKLV